MNELILYTNPQSRGRIAHWMMEELGLPYDTVWVDFGPPMKSPDYLAVNPMGKAPAGLGVGVQNQFIHGDVSSIKLCPRSITHNAAGASTWWRSIFHP